MGRHVKSSKGKAEPKRSTARKPPTDEGARVRDLEKRLSESLEREKSKDRALIEAHAQVTEALEQQTATSEILRVISRSPIDVQPVFDAIAANALRLCDGVASFVFRHDGALIHLAAFASAEGVDMQPLRHIFPAPPERVTFVGRVVTTARVLYIGEIEHDRDAPPGLVEFARANDFRSIFAAPMLHDGHAIGAIAVTHRNVNGFTAKQGGLLETFADQAVIAIENVRLFNELESSNRELTVALEQQTATAEILRVISTSPTDLQPVLDALARSAVHFCGAYDATLFQVDGTAFRVVAHHGPIPFPLGGRFPLVRGYLTGRSILDRQPVHVPDLQTEAGEFPEGSAFARQHGHRTALAVPLLREGEAIGTIQLRRVEMSPFTDKQIELLKVFADQAVIAIENVRLFTELQQKNEALTQAHAQVSESLEQQTATSEILRVISRSPTDVQPVIDAIARSAAQLCEAGDGSVWLRDDETLVIRSHYGSIPAPPQRNPIGRAWVTGRAVVDGRPIHVDDLVAAGDEFPEGQAMALRDGHRTSLATPLLREGKAIGAILIRRAEVRPFSDKHIELLKTFADQAVIAIENVRLFNELQQKNAALTQAHAQVTEVPWISKRRRRRSCASSRTRRPISSRYSMRYWTTRSPSARQTTGQSTSSKMGRFAT